MKKIINLSKEDRLSIQKIELDIFKDVLNVIEKLNLKYFCVGGTALGAKKYKGFIPWDDDIDIALPREDYEIFKKTATIFLPKHLFLQNSQTDKNFSYDMCKIRNLNTIFTEYTQHKQNIKTGIFIDVFPIDYNINKKIIDSFRYKLLGIFLGKRNLRIPSTKIDIKTCILKAFGIIFVHKSNEKIINKINKLVKNNAVNSGYCKVRGKLEKERYFIENEYGYFENLKISLPFDSHEYLKGCYGDYLQDPPLEKQVSHHWVTDFSLTKDSNNW